MKTGLEGKPFLQDGMQPKMGPDGKPAQGFDKMPTMNGKDGKGMPSPDTSKMGEKNGFPGQTQFPGKEGALGSENFPTKPDEFPGAKMGREGSGAQENPFGDKQGRGMMGSEQTLPTTPPANFKLEDFNKDFKQFGNFTLPEKGFAGKSGQPVGFPGLTPPEKGKGMASGPAFMNPDQAEFAAHAQIAQKFAEKASSVCGENQQSDECLKLQQKIVAFNPLEDLKFQQLQQGTAKNIKPEEMKGVIGDRKADVEQFAQGISTLAEKYGLGALMKPFEQKAKQFGSFVEKAFTSTEKNDAKGLEKNVKEFGKFNDITNNFSVFNQNTLSVDIMNERIAARQSFLDEASSIMNEVKDPKQRKALQQGVDTVGKLVNAAQDGKEQSDKTLFYTAADLMEQQSKTVEKAVFDYHFKKGNELFQTNMDNKLGEMPQVVNSLKGVESSIPKEFQSTYRKIVQEAQRLSDVAQKANTKGDNKQQEDAWKKSIAAATQAQHFAEKFNAQLTDQALISNLVSDATALDEKLGGKAGVKEATQQILKAVPQTHAYEAQKMLISLPITSLEQAATVFESSPEAVSRFAKISSSFPEKMRQAIFSEQIERVDSLNQLEEAKDLLVEEVEGVNEQTLESFDRSLELLENAVLPETVNEQAVELIDQLRDQLNEVEDSLEADAYVGSFVQAAGSLIKAASAEKLKQGLIPYSNIDEQNQLFAPAMELKEDGALKGIKVAKDGTLNVNRAVDRKEFGAVLSSAVGKKITPKGRGTMKKADVVRDAISAYGISGAPKDQKQLAEFAQALGLDVQADELGKKATVADMIKVTGQLEKSVGELQEAK